MLSVGYLTTEAQNATEDEKATCIKRRRLHVVETPKALNRITHVAFTVKYRTVPTSFLAKQPLQNDACDLVPVWQGKIPVNVGM